MGTPTIELARFWQESWREVATYSPPLGLACIKAYLREHGVEARMSDVVYERQIFDDSGRWFREREQFTFEAPALPLVLAMASYLDRSADVSGLPDDAAFKRAVATYCAEHDLSDQLWLIMFAAKLRLCEAAAERLAQANIVGLSVWYINLLESALIAKLVRRRNAETHIVFGGPHVSQCDGLRDLLLLMGICDSAVVGEGEATTLELVEELSTSGNYRRGPWPIPGLASVNPETRQVAYAPRRTVVKLEDLPLPDWSDLHLSPTRRLLPNTLPHYTSRGCIARCEFCSEWQLHGPRLRQKPPAKVVDELTRLQAEHKVFRVYFQDSMLNGSNEWLDELADGLLSSGLIVQWSSFFRASISERTAQRCQRAGLRSVSLGIESFSDSSLELVHKQSSTLQNLEAVWTFLRQGVHVHMDMIVNIPQKDTGLEAFEEERRAVARFAESAEKQGYSGMVSFGVFPFDVRPGSLLSKHPERFGISLRMWGAQDFQDEVPERLLPTIGRITRSFTTPLPAATCHERLQAMYETLLPLGSAKRRFEPFDEELLLRFQREVLGLAV